MLCAQRNHLLQKLPGQRGVPVGEWSTEEFDPDDCARLQRFGRRQPMAHIRASLDPALRALIVKSLVPLRMTVLSSLPGTSNSESIQSSRSTASP